MCVQTAVGLMWSRLGENRSPRKGATVRGMRVEQRVRISPKMKIIATGVRLGGKTAVGGERGRALGVEAIYKDAQDPQVTLQKVPKGPD